MKNAFHTAFTPKKFIMTMAGFMYLTMIIVAGHSYSQTTIVTDDGSVLEAGDNSAELRMEGYVSGLADDRFLLEHDGKFTRVSLEELKDSANLQNAGIIENGDYVQITGEIENGDGAIPVVVIDSIQTMDDPDDGIEITDDDEGEKVEVNVGVHENGLVD